MNADFVRYMTGKKSFRYGDCGLIICCSCIKYTFLVGMLKLDQSFCDKSGMKWPMVYNDCVSQVTEKKSCKYGVYGLFELLLFLQTRFTVLTIQRVIAD